MSNTYHGNLCRKCLESLKYASSNKCVFCMAEAGKRRFAARMERQGNQKLGLTSGFVRFGTTAHAILLHIHEHGPSSHAELTEALEVDDISTNLRRLYVNGFLFRVGRSRLRPGTRTGAAFNITPSKAGLPVERKLTGSERTAAYRANKRLKVPSVFEFRGSVSL